MSLNPWKEDSMAELTATLKYGKGYEESWLVLRAPTAAELKEAIEEATGVSGEGMTLVDQIHNATQHVHSLARAGTVLGATVIESSAAPQSPQAAPQQPAEAPVAPEPTLLEKIAQAGSQSDLSDLFLKNKAAFTADQKLMDALQERSKQV